MTDMFGKNNKIIQGDCLDVLKEIPDESIDAIITDPPYGLKFMGKKWDDDCPPVEVWKECLRVLKPGGHLLSFSGTRTVDLVMGRIREAGFEIRDMITWLYGSGFPKSSNIGKAIDKAKGAERKVVGKIQRGDVQKAKEQKVGYFADPANKNNTKCFGYGEELLTVPATLEAQQWDGWGTALKPACEPITMARKSFDGTVANNVLNYGTGAINIDECRVGENPGYKYNADKNGTTFHGEQGKRILRTANKRGSQFIESTKGRWPANVILDEGAGELLNEQIAGVSRFFYCAKASRKERERGLDCLGISAKNPDGKPSSVPKNKNHHPTVKPLDLMRYLVRLVVPPNGIVLDPYAGTGTTLIAAVLEDRQYIGVEKDKEYVEIAEERIKSWTEQGILHFD